MKLRPPYRHVRIRNHIGITSPVVSVLRRLVEGSTSAWDFFRNRKHNRGLASYLYALCIPGWWRWVNLLELVFGSRCFGL